MHSSSTYRRHRLVATICLCICASSACLAAQPLLDPTRPYGAGAAPRTGRAVAGDLQLQAILHGATRRVAIINGQLAHEGDRIAGSVIEAITPAAVRYSRDGRQHTLRLPGADLPERQMRIRRLALATTVKETRP